MLCGKAYGNEIGRTALFYTEKKELKIVEVRDNNNVTETTYTPSDRNIKRLFRRKIDSLRKANPEVDIDALVRLE